MTENESQSHGVEELMELVECCICAKTFNDPRLLPCAHSFCLKCLQDTGSKSGKEIGDKMPCPLCTVEFIIPQNGFSGLQKNFFVEKLMNLPGLRSLNPTAKRIDCDVCLEESDPNSETEVSAAEIYCEDCHQSLCKDCFKQHNRFQATKSHKVVTIGDPDYADIFSETHSQTPCIHRGRVDLNIFCSDCKTVVCALCFVETHQLHKGADATKVANDFRKRVKETAKELSEKLSEIEEKNSQLDHNKEELFQVVEGLENSVRQRFEELKIFGEKHMQELLSELDRVQLKRLKEIENIKLSLDQHEGGLDSMRKHCDQLSSSASVMNACHGMHAFSEKVDELKSVHQQQMQQKIDPFQASLKKTTFEELATPFKGNILGALEIKENPVAHKASTYEIHAAADEYVDEEVDSEISDADLPMEYEAKHSGQTAVAEEWVVAENPVAHKASTYEIHAAADTFDEDVDEGMRAATRVIFGGISSEVCYATKVEYTGIGTWRLSLNKP